MKTVEYRPGVISCHHNYVSEERYDGLDLLVTRKGAISAGSGEWGIIPGSMGTESYIVRGLGNEKSFNSASHGAGRRMSRNAAKRKFSTKDLEDQTRGVECRKDSGVVDEIPGAYKPIGQVIEQQKDLVRGCGEAQAGHLREGLRSSTPRDRGAPNSWEFEAPRRRCFCRPAANELLKPKASVPA